jgi:hypothetical protein
MAILDSILLSFHSTAAFFSPSLSPCLILLDQHLLKVSRVEALKHNPMPVLMLPDLFFKRDLDLTRMKEQARVLRQTVVHIGATRFCHSSSDFAHAAVVRISSLLHRDTCEPAIWPEFAF